MKNVASIREKLKEKTSEDAKKTGVGETRHWIAVSHNCVCVGGR